MYALPTQRRRHRAAPETTPLWRLFLINLSLSLSLALQNRCRGCVGAVVVGSGHVSKRFISFQLCCARACCGNDQSFNQ